MDFAHSSGILFIQHLQNNYRQYHNFISPSGSISVIILAEMIWVSVIGDWLNHIFKWILFGQQPYRVQETSFYHKTTLTLVFLSAGSPSGHALGSSCVWYVMITSALNFTRFRLLRSGLWMSFWVIQISVRISRVFIATHFPHQVNLCLLAGEFHFLHSQTHSLVQLKLESVPMLFSPFAVWCYLLFKVMDIDLLWSVTKTKKWCANREWIHLDTSPIPDLSSCEGDSCLQLYDFIEMSTHIFFKSASVPLGVVVIIPYCVHLLIGEEDINS
uniref:Glucose-6-phosphatase catalytic subunit 2 n=1 Tax=Scophthalmus maximus TaxID=52904 RepID=A0A8D3CL40_SCOMX